MSHHLETKKLREYLLQTLEGGQYHIREKFKHSGSLPYQDFLRIGIALKECLLDPQRHEELISKLKPHADVIIGVLPPGIQSHGLVPSAEDVNEPLLKPIDLSQVNDLQLRQWIVDDGSLVYGELSAQELEKYFAEIGELIEPGGKFVDLGSGLGKVVMTAAMNCQFDSCTGIEIVPYRHRLAMERFADLLKLEQGAFDLSNRVNFELGDMFTCNLSGASLVFTYSTCFGSFIHKLAHKLALEAPESCLISTTTYQMLHPGLELIKHFPANSLAWTDVFVYRRVGAGPWAEPKEAPAPAINHDDWEAKARSLLGSLTSKE